MHVVIYAINNTTTFHLVPEGFWYPVVTQSTNCGMNVNLSTNWLNWSKTLPFAKLHEFYCIQQDEDIRMD